MNRFVGFMVFLLIVGVSATGLSQGGIWSQLANEFGLSIKPENLSFMVFGVFAVIGIIALPIYMFNNDNADDTLEATGAGIIGLLKWVLMAVAIVAVIYLIGYFFGSGFSAASVK